jgi:hypothetical protein
MFDSENAQFDTAQNNLGLNFGGVMMYALNDRVGVRVDLRYFRAFVDSAMNEGGFFKDLRLLAHDLRGGSAIPAMIEIGFCRLHQAKP